MAEQNLNETRFFLAALGLSVGGRRAGLACALAVRSPPLQTETIDGLRPVHVTGTKGKGSTCAFVESLLRRAHFRTGFFR